MIPIPSVHINSASRPGTSMSGYDRANTAMSFLTNVTDAQTPDAVVRKRASMIPTYSEGAKSVPRKLPSQVKLPPSSFRDGIPTTSSRPPSRSGAFTPIEGVPIHQYVPSNMKDPLDVEVSVVVNSIPHGLLIERIDPPLRTIPAEGEEIKAQYAFTNAIARKVITCKLTTMTRSGPRGQSTTKKVMCRVGGGMSKAFECRCDANRLSF